MLSVSARKIRDHATSVNTTNVTRVYVGQLVSMPTVGRGMVIFRDPHGHRMITTPVKRVLTVSGSTSVYVETENSVYRLEIETSREARAQPAQKREAIR